jgi:hypothetical protein
MGVLGLSISIIEIKEFPYSHSKHKTPNLIYRRLVTGLVYWLVMIMVLVIAANALGLPKASDILSNLSAYVPKAIAALLVLVVAMFLASFM